MRTGEEQKRPNKEVLVALLSQLNKRSVPVSPAVPTNDIIFTETIVSHQKYYSVYFFNIEFANLPD